MNVTHVSNEILLERVIGAHSTTKWYHGELRPIFEMKCFATSLEMAPLAAASELLKRLLVEELKQNEVLSSPEKLRDYLKLHFTGRGYESFVAIFLDVKNRLITAEEIFRGTLAHTSVYPREIIKSALAYNAAGVIFAHNHPSGDVEPSAADKLLTETLKTALALVDVRVLDHAVIAGNKVLSFAEEGLL